MGAYQSNDHAMDGMGNLRDRREMENNSREHQQCLTLLRKRENLKVADFNTWWNKNGMKCLKEKGWTGNTLFQVALYVKPPEAVMLTILHAWPGAVKELIPKHDEGANYTNLHLAIEDKVPEQVMLDVLNAWPDACKHRDKRGMLPLAYALRYSAPMSVFLRVLEANTDAAQETNIEVKGQTHLKLAVLHDATDEIVSILLNAWPDAINEKDAAGETVLHTRCFAGAPADAVARHLQSFSSGFACFQNLLKGGALLDTDTFLTWWTEHSAACIKETTPDTGCNVLHLALASNVPERVMVALVTSWPAGVKQRNAKGQIPLATALQADPSEGSVVALLKAWPDSAKLEDGGGKIPLQNALVSLSPTPAKIRPLLEMWPEAAMKVDGDGNTALHLALEARNRRAESVRAVLSAWPGAAKEKNGAAKFPFQLTLKIRQLKKGMYYPDNLHDSDAEMQLAVLDAWPGVAVGLRTNPRSIKFGTTLVQTALLEHTHESVVLELLRIWPDAAKIVDDAYGCTLLERAISMNAPVTIVRAILKLSPADAKKVSKTRRAQRFNNHFEFGGGTMFHKLAENEENAGQITLMHKRLPNDICFALAAAGTSITAVDVQGNSAEAEHINSTSDQLMLIETQSSMTMDELFNHHLLASFREVARFQALPHLGLMHLRDWTTVSHSWSPPSAKWTALTVLLVGETYRRKVLPRLPMDAWYKILNMIPRHELRQGYCSKAEEDAALGRYTAMLGAAAEAKRKSTARQQKGHNLRGRHF